MDKDEEALQYFQDALEIFDSTEPRGPHGIACRKSITKSIHRVKQEMGLTSAATDVEECRRRSNQLASYKIAGAKEILFANHDLVRALKRIDPPDYFEIVKILSGIFADSQRIFGPEHHITLAFQLEHLQMKKLYTEFLRKLAADIHKK